MIKFGVFTDLHYAKDFINNKRRCDLSLLKLQNIVTDFNNRDLDFCVCLGDIINSVQNFEKDKANILDVYQLFNNLSMPYHITLGNHDLESMSKSDFFTLFGKNLNKLYYSFSYENSKFIVLDANFLPDGNDYNNDNYDWNNANISKEQLLWLDHELQQANEENIIIFIHQNLDYRISNGELDSCIVVNYKEVVKILEKYNQKVTIIQGHYHEGYHQIINNIEYITLKTVCEGSDLTYLPRIIVSIDENISIEYLE
jgi:alkaline phosphatase